MYLGVWICILVVGLAFWVSRLVFWVCPVPVRYLVPGNWTRHLVPGTRRGARNQVPGAMYLVTSTKRLVPGTWFQVPSAWVCGTR